MATSSLRNLAILLVVVVAGTLVCNNDVVMVSAQLCGGSIPDAETQCGQYVVKTGPEIPPSPACCTVLTKFNVKCICQHITQEIVDVISVPKLIDIANACGVNLPHGTKCGAMDIP